MPTLLVIEVSPRHAFSTSRRLTAHFIDAWKAAHPGSVVVVRDLIKTPPPFVDHAWIGGAFTPREQHSPESAAAIKVSDDLNRDQGGRPHRDRHADVQLLDPGSPQSLYRPDRSRRRDGVAKQCRFALRQEGHHHSGKRRRLQP